MVGWATSRLARPFDPGSAKSVTVRSLASVTARMAQPTPEDVSRETACRTMNPDSPSLLPNGDVAGRPFNLVPVVAKYYRSDRDQRYRVRVGFTGFGWDATSPDGSCFTLRSRSVVPTIPASAVRLVTGSRATLCAYPRSSCVQSGLGADVVLRRKHACSNASSHIRTAGLSTTSRSLAHPTDFPSLLSGW